jgi:hypothetical protein
MATKKATKKAEKETPKKKAASQASGSSATRTQATPSRSRASGVASPKSATATSATKTQASPSKSPLRGRPSSTQGEVQASKLTPIRATFVPVGSSVHTLVEATPRPTKISNGREVMTFSGVYPTLNLTLPTGQNIVVTGMLNVLLPPTKGQ